LTKATADMKIAEIDWPVFWSALGQQKAEQQSAWLSRWVFADGRVRLSMHPVAPDR